MGKIDDNKGTLIVDRMLKGAKQIEVAKELNLGQTSVRRVWNRYLETGSTDNRPRSGKPPKTTEKKANDNSKFKEGTFQ